MTKARRKIDAALKAKIALEALGKQATMNDLAQRYQVHPNQIYAWKKQLRDFAARAFDAGIARDADAAVTREIEKLHAKIGQLRLKMIFSPRVRQISASNCRAKLDRDHPDLSVRRQCAMLGVARSSVCRKPAPANDNDLALMRRIDARHTERPFLGSRRIAKMLGQAGLLINRSAYGG